MFRWNILLGLNIYMKAVVHIVKGTKHSVKLKGNKIISIFVA